MTRPTFGYRGWWLWCGLSGVALGGWWVTRWIAIAHHWQPSAMWTLYGVGVLAVIALTSVLVWLQWRPR